MTLNKPDNRGSGRFSTYIKPIGVVAIAIVGAQVPGLLGNAKQATALKCEEIGQQFSNVWQNATQAKPAEPGYGQPIESYYDVRLKRDAPLYRPDEAPEIPHVWQNGQWVEGKAAAPAAPAAPEQRTKYGLPVLPPPGQEPLEVPSEPPPPPEGWKPISFDNAQAEYQRRRAAARDAGIVAPLPVVDELDLDRLERARQRWQVTP